jgi:ABC-2 type transport system ATP-binding protein
VRGLDLKIERGEIFGLIGPDGAGKTTTFHILGGVLEPTGGQVLVLGRIPREAKLDIGYLTQQFSLPLDLSIEENMRYTAGIRAVPEAQFQERSKRYLKQLGLQGFGNRLAGQLSGGMKQKLALCCALITRPKLLLLDEPTTGVDPVSRREFWDVLAGIAAEGVTIAVATPYLDEAERCNRVALIHEGAITQLGTPRELRQRLKLKRLMVRCDDLSRLEAAVTGARAQLGVADVQPFGDRLDLLVPDAETGERRVQELAQELAITGLAVERDEPTLENVFVASLKTEDASKSAYRPFPFLERAEQAGLGSTAISASNLYKKFGHFEAVKHVDLSIRYGEIYGLLGANGAGKTTTIKMLCGLLEPTAGLMMLSGQSRDLRSQKLRQRIGYMSQKFTLYDDLTIYENLEFYCGVYQVPLRLREDRIRWVLASCDLLGRESLMTGQLPGGWKQRLSFGASVMHEPEILFLDEPTSGVDPIARRQLWNMIRDFARHGTAILVTTHFLEEAENCHRLGFMVAGRLVAQGTPGEIKSSQPGRLIVLVTGNPQKASDLLKTRLESWRVSIFADTIHIVLDNPEKEFKELLDLLGSNGITVQSHKYGSFSLEDAFIGVVQRAGGAEP